MPEPSKMQPETRDPARWRKNIVLIALVTVTLLGPFVATVSVILYSFHRIAELPPAIKATALSDDITLAMWAWIPGGAIPGLALVGWLLWSRRSQR